MAQEDTKEAPKADGTTEGFKTSEQTEGREKKTPLPWGPSNDQSSQKLPVEDADRAAEGDSVSKADKDLEEQQTQDNLDDPLRPPAPPSLVSKGRPFGPTAGGGGLKPRPKPVTPVPTSQLHLVGMLKFFSQIWSLTKKMAVDTRDDFRKFISGQGSTEGPLKASSPFDSEEFAPRGKEGKKTESSVPKNSGKKSTSGKQKVTGSGKKEAPVPTDESTVVAPVPAEDIQPEKVTQSSDDPPVVEDAGEVQSSPPKDGNPDTTVEDGIDFDDSFGPPPLPR
ncbi:hypothetical protein F5146DRAFT_1136624 [Armillaria mellea]|nr:hypothetical protein F5146DRAFT_1136624 [Armillaria mellea]